MKKKGFTLIELLVVIAVIAVLMGILMPSLRMAREQARSVACSSNLKTLVLGWRLYAENNGDRIVSAATPKNANRQNPGWVRIPQEPASATIEEKIEHLKLGAMWPYITNHKAYRCPSDRRMSSPAHNQAYRSYCLPGGLNGVGSGSWEIKEPCKSLNDIKNPSRKYAFFPECDTRGYNMGSWVLNPVSGQWVDALAIWHRGRSTNFGFVDGHVEKKGWQSQDFVDWCKVALDEPTKFQFRRSPASTEERADWRWALGGYAYKALTGKAQNYGGSLD